MVKRVKNVSLQTQARDIYMYVFSFVFFNNIKKVCRTFAFSPFLLFLKNAFECLFSHSEPKGSIL